MSDFKYKGPDKDVPPSRISGVVSRLASTGKEVLAWHLNHREEVISNLRNGVRRIGCGELQASVTSTRRRILRFTDFALNLTQI